MLNKMFYSVRIMAILGLSLIGTCYCAYAYITEVPYKGSKPFILLPNYKYTAEVIGVGVRVEDAEINWGWWQYKDNCYVRSVHNQDKQTLYKNQTIYPQVVYDGNKEQRINFQFLRTVPDRQPTGVFCKIKITALDMYGKQVSDAQMQSLTQMTMRENTLVELEEQQVQQQAVLQTIKQEQKNTLSLSDNSSSETDDLLIGYGNNEEADHGCCGSKKRPHGV